MGVARGSGAGRLGPRARGPRVGGIHLARSDVGATSQRDDVLRALRAHRDLGARRLGSDAFDVSTNRKRTEHRFRGSHSARRLHSADVAERPDDRQNETCAQGAQRFTRRRPAACVEITVRSQRAPRAAPAARRRRGNHPTNLYPSPCTVSTNCGWRGFGSTFWRSQATCTSTVRVDGIEW